jgi:flavin-dependent dehydrogenase
MPGTARSASGQRLDYKDPLLDPHQAFQRFKTHPFISDILRDGQLVRFGAKALPEGGWNTQPTLYADGALIVGDAANFVNSMRLKGIHLAMRSGMLAAETAFAAVRRDDTSKAVLAGYKAAIDTSAVKQELYPASPSPHRSARPGDSAVVRWPPGHKDRVDHYGLEKRHVLAPSNGGPTVC